MLGHCVGDCVNHDGDRSSCLHRPLPPSRIMTWPQGPTARKPPRQVVRTTAPRHPHRRQGVSFREGVQGLRILTGVTMGAASAVGRLARLQAAGVLPGMVGQAQRLVTDWGISWGTGEGRSSQLRSGGANPGSSRIALAGSAGEALRGLA